MLPPIFSLAYLRFLAAPKKIRARVVTQFADTLQDIDWRTLHAQGIRLLVFDYDDTLAGHREHLDEEVSALLKRHSEAGNTERFHLAILSNRRSARDQVRLILDDTVLYFRIGSHRKPHPEAFLPILREHNLRPEAAAMIGDRGGTDMWGAYLLGFGARILVAPFSDQKNGRRPSALFRLLRAWENRRLKV